GGRLQEDVALTPIIRTYRYTPTYSVEVLETLPDELEMTFVMSTLTDPVVNRDIATTVTASPESTQEAEMPPDYIFEFTFTVPFYRAVKKQVNDTQTVDGTSVTLKSVSITPMS